MNAGLYVISYVAVAVTLGLAAWASPRALRLPGLARLALGAAATPLVLPVLTLALTLAWPNTSQTLVVGAPLVVAIGVIAVRRRTAKQVAHALIRRGHRLRVRAAGAIPAGAAIALLAGVAVLLWQNGRAPLTAHDSLIYFNESRAFAQTPAWSTYLDRVNPTATTAPVMGHTHTWLYPTFIAQALMATAAAEPGAGHDAIARLALQANLLWLVVAAGAFAWAITGRQPLLTVLVMAATVTIPQLGYITTAASIDAFRILPLLLAALVLSPGPRGRAGWALGAGFLVLAGAAHTLNLIYAPLLAGARLLAGVPRGGWPLVGKVFVPCCALGLAPVAAYYLHLWSETGRILGHGMNYYFYAGTPLEDAAGAAAFRRGAPSFAAIMEGLTFRHGWWHTSGALMAAAVGVLVGLRRRAVLFPCLALVVFWLPMLSGILLDAGRNLTWMMMRNFRYPLVVWMFAAPAVAALAAALWRSGSRPWAPWRRGATVGAVLAALAALAASAVGIRFMNTHWRLTYDPARHLATGDAAVAAAVAGILRPGETWMSDRNTPTYYSATAPIFLFTPAGHRWLKARDADEAWALLAAERVRVVALSNRDPDWWPRTSLHAALMQPGHAEQRAVGSWQLFVLNLPPAEPTKTP